MSVQPRRRFTDRNRAEPGLVFAALITLAGWAFILGALFGWAR